MVTPTIPGLDTDTQPRGLRIIELVAENVKRIEAVEIRPDGNVVEITGKNGQGKQQPVSEPVLTPTGWRSIGSLAAGDHVIGSDGTPTEVLGVYPQSERRTFRVGMSDGASTRCGPDHLWAVHAWRSSGGETVRVPETLSTAELMRRGVRNGSARKWAVPLVAPVEFADLGQEMPIDPYALGVILGDGHIEPTGYVTVDSDKEILDALMVDGWRGERELGTGFWSRPLRHLGLAGKLSYEKFIPKIYQRASIADRTALFLGLMDTDGTPDESWASYCTTSERLADDLVQLGGSLGHLCKKRTGATKKYRYLGELKEGRMAWIVGVKSTEPPFSLERKAARWSTSELRPEPRRFIDSIEQVEDEDSVCIRVAADDGLYVTRDHILTHNSSVLDAIWWGLAGASTIQAEPIRRGAKEALIRLDLGEFLITRTFRTGEAGMTTTLSVANREGAVYRTPQALLDGFLGTLSLDPLAFVRMDPKAQFTTLRSFAPGVDFEAIEADNSKDYNARTDLNRELKRQRALIERMTAPNEPDLPAEPIDEAAIVAEIEQVVRENGEIDLRRERRERAIADVDAKNLRAAEIDNEVGLVLVQMQQLQHQADVLRDQAGALRDEAEALQAKLDTAPPLPAPVNPEPVRARLNQAKNINSRLQVVRDRDAMRVEADATEASANALTKRMDARVKEAAALLAAAEMPVPGLTLTHAGKVLLQGLPFEQASDADQLRASIAIAMALNPKLRVIRVRDGSLLDADSMIMLTEMADAADYQVWIERVATDSPVGFEMVAGKVKEREPPETPDKDGKPPLKTAEAAA